MTGPRTTSRGGSRFYTLEGKQYWSVTTMLSALSKPALPYWAAKRSAEFAVQNRESWLALANTGQHAAAIDLIKRAPWRETSEKADLGTSVHQAVEAHTLGKPAPAWSEDVAPFMTQFERFVADFNPIFEMSEAIVFSDKQSYAGTLDLIVTIDGESWLIDVKTGATGPWPEVGLQLALYANADSVWLTPGNVVPMPKVDRAGVLKLRPDMYALHPVDIGKDVLMSALYCREMYRFQQEIAPKVIGAAMEVPDVAAS